MEKIAGLLTLLGLWILVASLQGEASASHIDSNSRKLFTLATVSDGQARTYIVHMDHSQFEHGSMSSTPEMALSAYSQLLQSVKQDSTLDTNGESATLPLHVYTSACHGFSAQLTSQEAEALRQVNGVLGVYPDSKMSLQTTRTPEFLGLTTLRGLWPEGHFGDDVIVGMIDTGVWPESDSFSDAGLGPIPGRWKGSCQSGTNFNTSHCNKKLIGARFYYAGYEKQFFPLNFTVESRSPRDTDGHGSHTSSTAAGSEVPGASLFGLANGTARGMAPKARIAVYKVCWTNGNCAQSDILAAIDQAVADGVDVISLSIGYPVVPLSQDPLAIGAFGAMRKGIFVSCSGGNSGPYLQTVTNIAPWLMTVAASTVDRSFPANVVLGNGMILHGQSLYLGNASDEIGAPLITGAEAAMMNATTAAECSAASLDPALVKGKIVVCRLGGGIGRVAKGAVVLAAGGAGMIVMNTAARGESVSGDSHLLPATYVGFTAGRSILGYMNSTRNPVGRFQFLGTQYNVKPAPKIAGFSSRGPNTLTPQILKPDITAPGVNILAAWTGAVGPSRLEIDTRRVPFNIVSGTSMACPHISGLAALLKAAHPDWSPSAIKSAMMTTATLLDNTGGLIKDGSTLDVEATPFAFGVGHVRPEKALDPGLVYDMGPQDYLSFLCALNYSAQDIKIFTHNETVYSCAPTPMRLEDLNYPSFSAVFNEPPSMSPVSMNMTRTVTNVGSANATYAAQILAPLGAQISVQPQVLSFSAEDEKKSFTLGVTTVNTPGATSVTEFAFLVWTDGMHVVQSPIAITVYK